LAQGGARRSLGEGGLLYAGDMDVRTVYLIRSLSHTDETYVGSTSELAKRLAEHNAGQSSHTAKFAPWKLVVALQFADVRKANAFERYLKSGSGRAFANRHFR